MDGKRISGPKSADNRPRKGKTSASGLALVERDGYWHIYGTIRVAGQSRRLRKGTGLPATAENREAAETLADQAAIALRNEVIYGVKPSNGVGLAGHQFLERPRQRPLNGHDVSIVKAIIRQFGTRELNQIRDAEWVAFVDRRQKGNLPQTRERFINGVCAFLNWCRKKPRQWIAELPHFERDQTARNPKHRRARRVADLTPEILLLLLDSAPAHFAGQIAVEMATGARVSSVLFGCRICDLIAVPGRGQITFHDTKNGGPVVAALPDWTVGRLLTYLQWRGRLHDREAPLFLTDLREPYVDRRGKGGGQNKNAWAATRRRAVAKLRQDGAAEARALRATGQRDAAKDAIARAKDQSGLVAQVTQHWFRHRLATLMANEMGAAMSQGGWNDPRSIKGYIHDVPDQRRALVNRLLGLESPSEPHKRRDSNRD